MVKRCPNGHYYNGDKFQDCPFCAPPKPEPVKPSDEDEEEVVFASAKSEPATEPEKPAEVITEPVSEPEKPEEVITEPVSEPEKPEEVITEPVSEPEKPAEVITEPVTEPEKPAEVITEPVSEPEKPAEVITEAVTEPEKTEERTEQAAEPEKTEEASDGAPFDENYVIGWLVCVGGESYGESFELKSGINTIGRSSLMDVMLLKDEGVTEQSHAVIIYDAVSDSFSIEPGETVKIAYRNGEPVYKNEPLKAGDVITVGSTKLLLFPLCSEQFSWSNFKEE